MKKIIMLLVIISIVVGIYLFFFSWREEEESQLISPSTVAPAEKWKILHIMSYHSPWIWTDSQLQGFKDALKDRGIKIEVPGESKEKIDKQIMEISSIRKKEK